MSKNNKYEQQQRTIEAAWPIAKAVGRHMQKAHLKEYGGDPKWFHPKHWNGKDYITAAFAEPGTIEFRLNNHADVRITNLMPTEFKPEDIVIGPITPTGEQKVIRADIFSKNNHGFDDHQRELEYTDTSSVSTTETITNEMSVGMALEFEQSLGYGSEVAQIQGETRFKASFEAAFRRAWENSTTRTREFTMTSKSSFNEPGLHSTLYERVETVGPARQVITATGTMSFGIRVHSRGHWWYEWETLDAFLAEIQGVGNTGSKSNFDGKGGWQWLYRAHPVPLKDLKPFHKPVQATVEKVREFKESHRVEVNARFEPLNDKARYEDALKLVALKGESEELRNLAKAELEG